MASIRQWMRSYPLIVALIALVIGVGGILFISVPGGIMGSGLLRMVLSAIMILIIILAGGAAVFPLKPGALGFSLKKGIYPLLIALLFAAVALASKVSSLQSGEAELAANWPFIILTTAFFCFSVGLFEELLFRAITFDAFAARLGSTKRGVIIAMLISALIFGVVHILASFLGGIDINLTTILQMVLKTVQTGLLGFLLAAIYFKTRNIWGVVIIHFLFDFLEVVVPGVFSSASSGAYIVAGESGFMYVMVYLFITLISVPFIFIALGIVKKAPLPAETIFTEAITSKEALEKH